MYVSSVNLICIVECLTYGLVMYVACLEASSSTIGIIVLNWYIKKIIPSGVPHFLFFSYVFAFLPRGHDDQQSWLRNLSNLRALRMIHSKGCCFFSNHPQTGYL